MSSIVVNPNVAVLKRRPRLLIGFLALFAAAPALSTDMYLAAIPLIADGWQVPTSRVSLTLILWFVSFSVGLIFCGILSDRIGRKPVAIAGAAGFIIASVLCATAQDVNQLLLYRLLQGLAASCPSTMCLAISRDCFEGKERQRALALIGVLLMLAPMLAPFIGSVMLHFASWREIFLTQGLMGLLMLLGTLFLYRETIPAKETGKIGSAFLAYGRLARNGNYMLASVSMSLAIAPGFSFIGFSTIVYSVIYPIDSTTFAILFCVNAAGLMGGSLLCARLVSSVRDDVLIAIALGGSAFFGTMILFFGNMGYQVFTGLMACYSFCAGMNRPLANNLILDQVDRDIGAASSMIVFVHFLIGTSLMLITTKPWAQPMLVFGLIVSVIPGTMFLCWPLIRRRLYARRNFRSGSSKPVKVITTAGADIAPAADDSRE